jgi:hypothetical protein
MANKFMDENSASLDIKEMQIKMTLTFYLTLVIKVIIKKKKHQLQMRMQAKKEPLYAFGDNQYGISTAVHQKTKWKHFMALL